MTGWRAALRSPEVAVALVVLAVVAPFVKPYTAQPASRYALTAALVDDGTARLDRYEPVLGIDRAEHDGHTYSDKAPGQPLLATPAYAIARAVGAEPATRLRVTGNLGLWAVTVWSVGIPAALLALLVHRRARAIAPAGAIPAAIGLALGSLMLPFSAELYAHVLAGGLLFAAWVLVVPSRDGTAATPPARAARVVLAGALAGLGCVVEYPMALLAVIIGVAVVVTRGVRAAAPFAIAGVATTSLAAVYGWLVFHRPFATSYGSSAANPHAELHPAQAFEVLAGSRGLFLWSPIALIGVAGLALLLRDRRPVGRADAVVGLAAFVVLLALQASWPNPWGGEMPGPRYLIPALPFLGAGVARAWSGLGRAGWLLIGWGALAMSLPLITLHLLPHGQSFVSGYRATFDRYGAAPTIFTMAIGDLGWLLHATLVAAAVLLLVRRSRASASAPPSPTRP